MGNILEGKEKEELIKFLKENKNVFAWSHEDVVGIDPVESMHYLSVKIELKPIKQNIRKFTPERNEIIAAEVEWLLRNIMFRKVKYPD